MRSLQKNKITRATCRKRTGDAVFRAESFGDLITADNKVFNEGGESRNKYSVTRVTSQETERSVRKFLEPSEKPKVINTDNSMAFGKSCEESSWNHCTSTPHRSETKGIADWMRNLLISGARCGDSKGFLPQKGPANPSEVGVLFFCIFCSFDFCRDRQCHGTRNVHRLSSDKLLRSAVPSQWRTNTGD